MSARDEILARIRSALAHEQPPPPVLRSYRRATEAHRAGDVAAADALLERLIERLLDYGAVCRRSTPQQCASTVADLLAEAGIHRLVVPPGFPRAWLAAGQVSEVDGRRATIADLDAADGTVSTCALAVAETGTIVLDGGAGQGRRALSLVPDHLLVVVTADQVVAGVPEAVARLTPTAALTWISGPSATSDIELRRVEGVHGPRLLQVVVLTHR